MSGFGGFGGSKPGGFGGGSGFQFGGAAAPSTPTTGGVGGAGAFTPALAAANPFATGGARPVFGGGAAPLAPAANTFGGGGAFPPAAPAANLFGARGGFAAAPAPAAGGGLFGPQQQAAAPVATNLFGGGGAATGFGGGFQQQQQPALGGGFQQQQQQPALGGGFQAGNNFQASGGISGGFAGAMGGHQPMSGPGWMDISEPMGDSITTISMNGGLNMPTTCLVVTAWDNSIKIYQVDENSCQTRKIATLTHTSPILSADCLMGTNTFLFGDSAGNILGYDAAAQPAAAQLKVISAAGASAHSQAVRCLKCINATEFITAGWDSKVGIWSDFTLMGMLQLTQRAYAMDANEEFFVVGTADKKITVFDKRSLGTNPNPYAIYELPKYQIRSIALFANKNPSGRWGFCVGTIDGRVHIEYLDEVTKRVGNTQTYNFDGKQGLSSFNFKCHRETTEQKLPNQQKTTKIFTVNAINFNTRYNTFLTAGSDGLLEIWDADNKTKVCPLIGTAKKDHANPKSTFSVKAPVNLPNYEYKCPIIQAKFSPNSRLLFAAHSYDWSRGHDEYEVHKSNYPNTVTIFQMDDEMIRPKPSDKKR